MSDVTHNVQTNFQVVDHATGPMKLIEGAAHKLTHVFDHASHLLGSFGTIAGVTGAVFGIHEMVHETQEFLGNVKRIKDVTGLSAQAAGGLLDAFASGGIAADESVRAITMMSKAGAKLEMQMEAANGQIHGIAAITQQLGVDINKGPEQAMIRLAELAEKQKLSQSQLMLMFRVQPEVARKMVNVLKKGPEHLREELEEFKKLNIATEANVAMQARIRATQNKIKVLWENIMMIVGVRLLPIVEKLMSGVQSQLESWIDYAKQFGETLGGFLADHLSTVMKIAKVMLLNFTLMKATGTGLVGWMEKGGHKLLHFVKGAHAAEAAGHAAHGAAAAAAAGKAAMGAPYAAKLLDYGKRGHAPVGLLEKLGPLFNFLKQAGRLTLVAAAIAIAIKFVLTAVDMVKNNVFGLRDELMAFWEKAKARVQVIIDLFAPLGNLFSKEGSVGGFFTVLVPTVIMTLTDAVDGILHLVQTIILVIKDVADDWKSAIMHPIDTFTKAWAEADRLTKQTMVRNQFDFTKHDPGLEVKVPEERGAAPVYNFPNARFDITQKFAEGFDPDRVAAAFTNDLASLADRRVQSGFSPLFGLR